jgi:hypothetical protein
MASRKNHQISALCGSYIPADEVQRLRTDARYDNEGVARALGVPLQVYLNAVAAPLASERPINWTDKPGVGVAPYQPPAFVGVATIAFSHPLYPGYTFGPPVYVNT